LVENATAAWKPEFSGKTLKVQHLHGLYFSGEVVERYNVTRTTRWILQVDLGFGFRRRAGCMSERIETENDAIEFMMRVKFALRYNSTPSLPLASMYAAAHDTRRAIELTNALLSRGDVIETNVIANRLVLVYRDVVPALYALRTRFRAAKLSDFASRAFRLIQEDGTASAGDVRRFLAVDGMKRPDPADLSLAELQREMLIDRGPSSVPKKGIPYLSKEGYPYRVFDNEHPDIVKAAKKIKVEDAIETIRAAAGSIPPKKFASMFKLCI
jgi:hypothetical protein